MCLRHGPPFPSKTTVVFNYQASAGQSAPMQFWQTREWGARLRIGNIVAHNTEVVSSDLKPRTRSVTGRHREHQVEWPSECMTPSLSRSSPQESDCQVPNATNACIRNVVVLRDDFSEHDVASEALRKPFGHNDASLR